MVRKNKFIGIPTPADIERAARRMALKDLRVIRGSKAKLIGRKYS